MHFATRSALVLFSALVSHPGVAFSQTPAFSLEAVAVNGQPLPGGPSPHVRVTPGDVVTAEFFLRDWSPNGERLRSFQATLSPASFTTGDMGTIQPVDYGVNESNEANAFVDETDRRYIYRGRHTIPIVDTATEAYRWIVVLFDEKEAPESPQDGTKFYCGTVRLNVSEDAAGAFELGPAEAAELTLIVSLGNEPISGLTIEPLKIEVAAAGAWLRIQSSDPRSGSVDARMPRPADGSQGGGRCGWNSIRLSSSGDAGGLSRSDFTVSDGSDDPPAIRSLRPNGSTVELVFDRGISPYRWTRVVHKPSDTATWVGCLPGDVNNDGQSDGRDLFAMVDVLNGRSARPLYQTDIDADGALSARDLARLIDVLEKARSSARHRLPRR